MSRRTIVDLSAALQSTVAGLLAAGDEVLLLDYPLHDNVGDSAIWLGERRLLSHLGVLTRFASDLYTSSDPSLAAAAEGRTVLLHGGGNFGDVWPAQQAHREHLMERVRRQRVVQMPQTLHFSDQAAVERARRVIGGMDDFTLLVRDRPSLAFAEEYFDCAVALAPDSAFALGPLTAPQEPVEDVIVLARTDGERGSFGTIGTPTMDWVGQHFELPWWFRAHGRVARLSRRAPRSRPVQKVRLAHYDAMARHHLNRGTEMLSRGRVVITDRLHAHILCLLLGTPHVLLDNSYGKVGNFVDAWTSQDPLCVRATGWAEAERLAAAHPAR